MSEDALQMRAPRRYRPGLYSVLRSLVFGDASELQVDQCKGARSDDKQRACGQGKAGIQGKQMTDLIEFIKFMTVVILAAVVLMLVALGVYSLGLYLTDRPACAEFGRISGQETFWSVGTSCIVKRGGEWVDYAIAVKKVPEITVKQN